LVQCEIRIALKNEQEANLSLG